MLSGLLWKVAVYFVFRRPFLALVYFLKVFNIICIDIKIYKESNTESDTIKILPGGVSDVKILHLSRCLTLLPTML